MRVFRAFMMLLAASQVFLAVAFILQIPMVVDLWPLPYTNDMGFIFIGSIFGAAAASTFWSLFTKEDGALAGIGLDYLTIFAPVSVFAFELASNSRNIEMHLFFVASVIGALFGLGLFLWSSRIPIRDPRPMPKLVRVAFILFTIALIIAGGALVLKTPNVVPWTINASGSIIYGWMFLGAAAYFVYGLVRPSWHNAAGQLAGFLVYDLVLIIPFINMLNDVQPARRLSLIVYMLVVSLSALLAIYYLFINPQTRMWGSRTRLDVQTA
jgi:hypothetical protein